MLVGEGGIQSCDKLASYYYYHHCIATATIYFGLFLQEGLEIKLHGGGREVEAKLLQNFGVEDSEGSNDLGLSLLAEVNICAS